MKLKGEVAVVTGATRGIGLSIAETFAFEGARLAITARDRERLATVENELRMRGAMVIAMPGDVTDESHVRRFAESVLQSYGRVDILVNNAGSAESEAFLKTDLALWNRMLAVNATSAFLVTRAFLPDMIKHGRGRVVMIASISGKRGAPYIAAYAASKHALLGLTRSLAEEFRGKGITVNAICPGYVDTPMTGRSVDRIVARTGKSNEEARDALAQMNPQKRFIKPEEVAARALEYALPDCAVTGEAADL